MRLIKMAVLTGFLTLSGLAQANAQSWHFVTINFAGAEDNGVIYVNVTADDASFTGVWCINNTVTNAKAVLAGALAAIAVQSVSALALLTNPTGSCIVHGVIAGPGP